VSLGQTYNQHDVNIGLCQHKPCVCQVIIVEVEHEVGYSTQVDELFVQIKVYTDIWHNEVLCKMSADM
jgi:hypothetical protein